MNKPNYPRNDVLVADHLCYVKRR